MYKNIKIVNKHWLTTYCPESIIVKYNKSQRIKEKYLDDIIAAL